MSSVVPTFAEKVGKIMELSVSTLNLGYFTALVSTATWFSVTQDVYATKQRRPPSIYPPHDHKSLKSNLSFNSAPAQLLFWNKIRHRHHMLKEKTLMCHPYNPHQDPKKRDDFWKQNGALFQWKKSCSLFSLLQKGLQIESIPKGLQFIVIYF